MKLGILITTFNRPEYLKECLESINRATIHDDTVFVIVDDASTDAETLKMIDDFVFSRHENAYYVKKTNNASIKDSLLIGSAMCFEVLGCTEVMNLDSDAVVRNDFIERILDLRHFLPESIVTGFHSTTKNNDGSERHSIIGGGEKHYFKKSVGGINMCFNESLYREYVEPVLYKCIAQGGNWDHEVSKKCYADGNPIVCVKESVIQHVGQISAMGHHLYGEPADVAHNFIPLHLPDVTLIGVDCVDFEELLNAAMVSTRYIKFGAVKLLTSIDTKGFEAVKIRHLGSKAEYNKFVLKELDDYFDTPYAIVFQSDGFIINYKAWTDDFLKYDYIGAKWGWYTDGKRCCNGGFSLRSKRLHTILKNDDSIRPINDHLIGNYEEDHQIGKIYRDHLEKQYGIKFSPDSIADKFSMEVYRTPDFKYAGSFGFHGWAIDFTGASLPYIPYLYPNSVRKVNRFS